MLFYWYLLRDAGPLIQASILIEAFDKSESLIKSGIGEIP